MRTFEQKRHHDTSASLRRSASAADHERGTARHVPPTLGNQAMQQWLNAGKVQTKLTVNAPGDTYEQEADRVADEVMHMPNPHLQIQALEDTHLQEKPVQAAAAGQDTAPPFMREALDSPGSELDAAALAFVEPRFGCDFSRVRIHTGAAAAMSAAAISARAYTIGLDVVFAAGEYRPGSPAGRRLLAHELTHVVQQAGGVSPGGVRQRAAPIRSAGHAGLIQRDTFELDETKTAACLALAEKAIKELEDTAGKPDYPLPDYIKEAIALLRRKMTAGKIKCYSFEGLVHGQFKGDEIRIDGNHPDAINASNLLHEGVHAGHKEKFPKAGKKYAESEGKEVNTKDPAVQDLLRWKAYTEYWAYRSKFDYYNPGKAEKDKWSEADIHKWTITNPGVRHPVMLVREFDPDFDPRVWKPKG